MSQAIKHDKGKPRIDLIPAQAILDIGAVLAFGAEKYGDNNWRHGEGLEHNQLYAAAMRHLLEWQKGKASDDESGFSHLAHAATNIIFLMACENENIGTDNRIKETAQ